MPGLDSVKLHLVDDFDAAAEFMRWLSTEDAANGVAIDTETTGIIVGTDRVRMAQVGGYQHGWAIPWHLYAGLFHDFVRRYEGGIITHNGKFDVGMLATQGDTAVELPLHRVHDTMVLSHIAEPHMSHALKMQAGRHVDALAVGAQRSLDQAIGARGAWTWETVPYNFGPYWQYSALDTVLTRRLFDVHYPTVVSTAPRAYELELAVLWVLYRMERRGVHVDVEYARENHDEFLSWVKRTATAVEQEYDVKPGSNAAVVKVLQGLGFEFDKKTASGALALDKEVLGGIDHPLAQIILRYRQRQKLAKTYLSHFMNEADEDGIIHPSINSLGARTSRMSMQNPNLQNLPRRSDTNADAQIVRNCVTARPGNTLLLCDFGQIEMRLLAHLSNCQPMIDAFHDTTNDFFVTLARQIFADPTIGKKDKRRSITKNAGYATIYGAGVPKFAKTAGVTEDDARSFFARWNQLYPEVSVFQRGVDRVAWERQKQEGVPYVRSPLTGRRHIGDVNKVYALVNFLIQGTAAETFKTKLLQLDALGMGEYMTIPVHDEIILDVPTDLLTDVAAEVMSVMTDDSMFSVPITASMSYGQRWGEKIDWPQGD